MKLRSAGYVSRRTLTAMQFTRLLILFVLVALLEGCASSMQVPESARESIDAVSISDTVVITPKPQFISGIGRLVAPALVGGLTGGLILASEDDKDEQYAKFLRAGQIDVAQIVRSEFDSQIRQHSFFGPRLVPIAKYRFEVSVPYHALVQKTSFGKYYRANVGVVVKLIGPAGEVMAEGRAQSCLFGECITLHELPELLGNPELLRQQYVEAARDAVRQVVKSL